MLELLGDTIANVVTNRQTDLDDVNASLLQKSTTVTIHTALLLCALSASTLNLPMKYRVSSSRLVWSVWLFGHSLPARLAK